MHQRDSGELRRLRRYRPQADSPPAAPNRISEVHFEGERIISMVDLAIHVACTLFLLWVVSFFSFTVLAGIGEFKDEMKKPKQAKKQIDPERIRQTQQIVAVVGVIIAVVLLIARIHDMVSNHVTVLTLGQ
jgi:hypothetical protein